MSDLRAAVFIDSGYLAKILKSEFGEPRLAFDKFSDLLVGETYERLRTYFYYCMPYQGSPPTDDEKGRYGKAQGWITSLQRLPRFEVRLGRLVKRGTSFEQKRVDVLLSVDLVRMSWDHQIQKAVLVSGDSDFVPAVQAAKDAGVLVHLCYSRSAIHYELLNSCDERFLITRDLINRSLG